MAKTTSNRPKATGKTEITPLRKKTLKGDLYARPDTIQSSLTELVLLPPSELPVRLSIESPDHDGYIPSECLVNLLRAERNSETSTIFEPVFQLLFERIIQSLPRADGPGDDSLDLANSLIRDEVIDRFVGFLQEDSEGYSEQLDYFEVRFGRALKTLRLDATKKVRNRQNRTSCIETDDGSGDILPGVEEAAGSFDPIDSSKIDDEFYRSQLYAAIDTLPPDHKRVIEMILKGFPIESKDPGTVTISKTLGKAEKTIRNYRDAALVTLKNILKERK